MISARELKSKLFKSLEHPYRIYEDKISKILYKEDVLLDVGCDRSAPVLENSLEKQRF